MGKHDVTLVFEDGRSVRLQADEAETVYLACLRNRVRIQTDCLEGACATCKAHCVHGEYRLDDYSEEALSKDEAALRQVLTCQMHVLSDCVIEFSYESKIALKTEPKSWPCTVVSAEMVSSTVCRLVLAPEGGTQDIGFLPGQYVHLSVPGTDQNRDYSFASPPHKDDQFTFYIKILDQGAMSEYASGRARPGDPITMIGPFGRFYLRPAVRPVLMIAGGTGLAPMLCMLDHLVQAGGAVQPIRLLVGANTPAELFGRDQIAAYAAKGLDVTAEYAVVDGGTDWAGAVGHVTALLRDELIAGGPDVYLCGPPPMIEAGETWLAAHGVDPRRIHTEKFLPS
jgi:NAD(P)H-flavin reductase/ferredoxin